MVLKLQILHASDFEAGIPALDDAVGFSALLEYFHTTVGGAYGVSDSTTLANTLTLSSGDTYIPGAFFNASSDPSLNGIGGLGSSSAPALGRADIAILNAFGIQASAFGNHEFDLGTRQVRDLLRVGSGNPGTNFPYLSTNLDFTTDENLKTELASNQTTAEASTLKNKIAKSTVITVAGNDGVLGTSDDQKIGIVGATTPTLRNISSPGTVGVLPANATDYATLAAEIQKTVDALKATGINKIILLSHMQQINIERDELAPRLNDVDVIIAGGSNTSLLDSNDVLRPNTSDDGDYPIVKTSASGQPTLVVNTDGNYRYVGRLVVDFDDNGVIDLNSLNTTLNGAFSTDEAGVDRVYGSDVNPKEKADSKVVAITDALRTVISTKDNTITGQTQFFLNGSRNDVRTQETNLGNLTADANLAYGRQVDPTVVISLKNGGGIRDNIGAISATRGGTTAADFEKLPPQPNPLAPNKKAGDVSQLDIENSLRFNNGLTLVTLTANQLLQVLEHGVSDTGPGKTPGRFPQVGGLIFSFDPNRPRAEDLNGDGVINTGEDVNNNGQLDRGQRIRSVALVNDAGKVTQVLVQDGVVVGDPNQAFRMITLNFLAGTTPTAGGDGYPFPQFIKSNPTLANRVDLQGETTTDLNGNGRIDGAVAIAPGEFTFASAGSEQDALAEYLADSEPFNQDDTPIALDRRIQNLSARTDIVLTSGRALTGSADRDQFRGTDEADILLGLGGRDRLLGLAGADVLQGGKGRDRLKGGKNKDRLDGGDGNDELFGNEGQDQLIGGLGSDLLVGGKARDVFALEGGKGTDIIRDFKDGQDKLGLSKGDTFSGLTLQAVGNGTLISNGSDGLALLQGVSPANLSAKDFTPLTP